MTVSGREPPVAEALALFAPFTGLSEPGRALLRQGASGGRVRGSAVVLHKGDSVSGAYVVLRGRLRVFAMTPDAAEATLYRIGPGETCVVALNCLFNDLLYPAWVQAETDSTVAVIPGAVYRKLFDTEPGVRDLTVRSLSTVVYRLMSELEDVHALTQKQRLARFLLSHASGSGELGITQQGLARHLGASREGVARLMRQLARMGAVDTGRARIAIRDAAILRVAAGFADPDGS